MYCRVQSYLLPWGRNRNGRVQTAAGSRERRHRAVNAAVGADSKHGALCSQDPSQPPLLLLQIHPPGMERPCTRGVSVQWGVLSSWLDPSAELGLSAAPAVLLGPVIAGGKERLTQNLRVTCPSLYSGGTKWSHTLGLRGPDTDLIPHWMQLAERTTWS